MTNKDIDMEQIQKLKEETGCGIQMCKQAVLYSSEHSSEELLIEPIDYIKAKSIAVSIRGTFDDKVSHYAKMRIKENENTALTICETELVEIESDLSNSEKLAEFLSSGKSLSSENPISQISNIQTDSRGYLAMYARSQLMRVEKLTKYLNDMEDKMIGNINAYDPDQFMRAMKILQGSLSSALELIKTVSNDDIYLNLFINETNNYVNNNTLQMNAGNGMVLPRESRDKIRTLLAKILVGEGEAVE